MVINQMLLLVWEVRHGSVMALREILAHQGASAGVFKPDSSMGGTLFIELEDKSIPNILKREREIGLNMQVSTACVCCLLSFLGLPGVFSHTKGTVPGLVTGPDFNSDL